MTKKQQNSESFDEEETSFDEDFNDEDNAFDESDDDSVVDSWQDSEDEDDQIAARDRQRSSASSAPNTSGPSYTFLLIVFGVVVVAMIPVWFQSPALFSDEELEASAASVRGAGSSSTCLPKGERVFTKAQLAKHTDRPQILLGFLGVVYDVTEGSYYQPKGSYHFFAGKDGTRAFLTGEFTAEELVDDISDLDESFLSGIDTWLGLYAEKYTRLGVVHGAYYDQRGCPTAKLRLVQKRIDQAKAAADEDTSDQQKYPQCNSEWNATEKRGKVWCTKLSGGVSRQWIGRPRQMYSLKNKTWRCACVNEDTEVDANDWCDQTPSTDTPTTDGPVKKAGVKYSNTDTPANCLFKHYSNCDPQATECPFSD